MSTSEQNPDVLVPEMMKQSIEVTKIISQNRIQQHTLEQISDTSVSQVVKELNEPCRVLSRDRLQRQFDNAIVGMDQEVTDKTRNAGSERSRNKTMMDMMSIGDCDSSMNRECDDNDMSILIKQICAKSDIISQCVLCLSGMTDQLRRKTKRCMRLIGTLHGEALSEMNHESYFNEETSKMIKKRNLETDVMNDTMFTSPGVIDEAGQASVKLALEELKDEDTNRTTMQDTFVSVNTLEEMNTNNQLITDKLGCQVPEQERQWVETNGTYKDRCMAAANTVKGTCNNEQGFDIAGNVPVSNENLDHNDGDQIIKLMTRLDVLHDMQCYLDSQQFETVPQTSAKLENDATCGVSESQKRFQLGTQFRDTSSQHSTHEHGIQSTHIEHHHQDNMCIATVTDEQLINDDEEKMGKGKPGGNKAIHARYGNRMQARTETTERRKLGKVRGS